MCVCSRAALFTAWCKVLGGDLLLFILLSSFWSPSLTTDSLSACVKPAEIFHAQLSVHCLHCHGHGPWARCQVLARHVFLFLSSLAPLSLSVDPVSLLCRPSVSLTEAAASFSCGTAASAAPCFATCAVTVSCGASAVPAAVSLARCVHLFRALPGDQPMCADLS